jgi:hypothetical protein
MKNVTITLDERLAARARVAAAKDGRSLSSWIGNLVRHELDPAARPVDNATWLDEAPWPFEGDIPTRTELYERLYDRPGFRGHQHRDLRTRRSRSGKKSGGD